jgi:tellurite resistance protein TerC
MGAFLIVTGIKMATQKDAEINPDRNPVLRLFRRLMPVTDTYEGDRFFVRRAGRIAATPLFIVVLVVETTDVIFAVDSIPAIFGVTTKPFIVFTSNVFAILGLRSLYFVLAGAIGFFRYLKVGLSLVLCFLGFKMLIAKWHHIETRVSLFVVAAIIGTSILMSLLASQREARAAKKKRKRKAPPSFCIAAPSFVDCAEEFVSAVLQRGAAFRYWGCLTSPGLSAVGCRLVGWARQPTANSRQPKICYFSSGIVTP